MSNNARFLCILFASIFVVSVAAGDIRISHAYYTEGGEVSEDVDIHNVDYTNQVSIYRDSLFASVEATLSDLDRKGMFSSHTMTRGEGSTFGIQLNAEVENEFEYGQSLATGFRVSDYIKEDRSLLDGATHARYFTDGGSINEDVFVDSVKYVNNAKIYPHSLYGEATADLVVGPGNLMGEVDLMDEMVTRSRGGSFGTRISTDAETAIHFEKDFATGRITLPKTDVSYSFEEGTTNADYFNQHISVSELIETDSSKYQAIINNAADKLQSSGRGIVTEDEYSGFVHTILMQSSGKSCLTGAWLETGTEIYGSRTDVPVNYVWSTSVNSDESSASDTIAIQAINGNRDIGFAIEGKADGLSDKVAGPSHLTPLGFIGISKELYMSYEITR